jgi:ligand-binding sensor domain-containing protein/two-component sensor histidine kinase
MIKRINVVGLLTSVRNPIMRLPILIYIVAFILVLSIRLYSQSNTDTIRIHFESITVNDGLSQGMVQCISQDKDGYMWFSSKDGLNRYDGYRITVFRNNPQDPYSLPDNYVRHMQEDDKGNFWIGTTTKGICLYDKLTERFYGIPAASFLTQRAEAVYSIQSTNGKLLVTSISNAYVFDISKLIAGNFSAPNLGSIKLLFDYNAEQSLSSNKITPGGTYVISWMNDESLWINFPDTIHVYSFNNTFTQWQHSAFPAAQIGGTRTEYYSVTSLPNQNKVIVRSGSKIYLVDAVQRKILHTVEVNNTNFIGEGSCFLDAHNRFYFSTSSGNYCFNPATLQLKPVVSNLKSFDICIYGFTDRSGTLWVGSSGHGIFTYNARKERFRNPGIGSWYFAQGKMGDVIIYDSWQFLKRINPATGKVIGVIPFPNIKPNGELWNDGIVGIQTMQCDKEGILWISCVDKPNSTYLIWYNTANQSIDVKQIAKSGRVEYKKLIIDNNNRLWMVKQHADNSRSLVEFDKTTKNPINEYKFPIKTDMQEYSFVSDWWQDAQGVFWFGTLQGLISFNEKKNEWQQWKNNPQDNASLSGDIIFSVCPDAKEPAKYLWVGTNGYGLNRFEYATGKCTRYTEKEGLPNSVVYCMLNDNAGNLWLSTNNGLSCLVSGKGFRNFSTADGLPGNEFNRYEKLKLSSGELVFGGTAGFTIFNPARVLQQNPASNIVLTQLSIYNTPVTHTTDSTIIPSPIGYANTITLPHHKNMFTIEFALLESSAANKKQYAYRLEGFDENWIPNGTKNAATYTNLSPGSYTFRVKGAGSDGVWNEQGTSVNIIILPAWYQTWWFCLLIVAVVTGGAYGLYRYRLQQLLKLHTLRNSIARDLHDEIGSTLSSISLYGESAKMMLSAEHPLNSVLTKINNSTNNMMESMSDIVWAINTRNDQFDNLINRMNTFANEVMEAKGCRVIFETNKETNKLQLNMEQRKNLYLLYKEIVNNAAKHSNCRNLWINITLDGNYFQLKVKDDGKGFNVDGNKVSGMGGNGILNIKRRADDLNATLKIDSDQGKGTEIGLNMRL